MLFLYRKWRATHVWVVQEAALMRACDDTPGTITSGEEVDARFFLKVEKSR